jgi:hypothetical protein
LKHKEQNYFPKYNQEYYQINKEKIKNYYLTHKEDKKECREKKRAKKKQT